MAVPAHAQKIWLKIALNAVRLPKFEPVNGISWSPRKIMVKDLRQRSGLAWFCACAESCSVVFNTGWYTVLTDNTILITANMQSETGFPSSHQLKSCVTSKSRLKLAARTVLSADAGLLVLSGIQSSWFCSPSWLLHVEGTSYQGLTRFCVFFHVFFAKWRVFASQGADLTSIYLCVDLVFVVFCFIMRLKICR